MFNSEYERDSWKVPLKKDFKWLNNGAQLNWSDAQWPHVVKFYNERGFNRNETLAFLRYHSSKHATILDVNPTEDEF
jgi:hypothetical protein